MSKTEKTMLAIMVVLLIGVVTGVTVLMSEVKNAGGVSQIMINVGKEFKHISKEIDKDE